MKAVAATTSIFAACMYRRVFDAYTTGTLNLLDAKAESARTAKQSTAHATRMLLFDTFVDTERLFFFFFLDELNDLRLVHPLWKLVRARKASLLPCEAMRTNADLCVAPGIIECVRQKKRTTQKKRAPITLKADCSFVCLVQKRTFKIGSWKNATSEFQKTSITLSYEWRFCATLLFISLSPPLRERNGFFFFAVV